jgi:tetratricopeptide (TPR) repeat protein
MRKLVAQRRSQGILVYDGGDYKAAEAVFRRSIEVEPDAVFAYANLSLSLLRLDRTDEALGVLQRGLQIRPSGQLYSNLGTLLFNRGDYVGAAEAFEHAVSSAKGRSNSYLRWANLADTLRWIPGREADSRKAYQEAIEQLRLILQRMPNDHTSLSRMGLYAARVGDKATAMALTKRAIVAAPDNREVRFRAAMTFELSGDRESALAELNIARERGYPINMINAEPDLLALRRDPRFHQPTLEGVK